MPRGFADRSVLRYLLPTLTLLACSARRENVGPGVDAGRTGSDRPSGSSPSGESPSGEAASRSPVGASPSSGTTTAHLCDEKPAGGPSRFSSIHDAAAAGDYCEVRAFLERDRGLANALDEHSLAPLHRSAARGDVATSRLILDHGADPNLPGGLLGWTPLHEAAGADADSVILLFLERGAKVGAVDQHGETPLHWAASRGAARAVRTLLANGADPRARTKYGQATPLHLAHPTASSSMSHRNEERPYLEVAALLINAGGDVNARDDHGGTPTHEAARSDACSVLSFLLERGADVNAAGTVGASLGETPLHVAAERGHQACVDVLLAHGADVSPRNWEGKQPLHLAVFAGSREIVERLVAAGADVGAPDNAGVSPLHLAALYDREEIALFLLAHGAQAGAENNAGQTPAAVARQYRHERLAGLLDEQGRGRQQAAQSEGPSPEADRGVAP